MSFKSRANSITQPMMLLENYSYKNKIEWETTYEHQPATTRSKTESKRFRRNCKAEKKSFFTGNTPEPSRFNKYNKIIKMSNNTFSLNLLYLKLNIRLVT